MNLSCWSICKAVSALCVCKDRIVLCMGFERMFSYCPVIENLRTMLPASLLFESWPTEIARLQNSLKGAGVDETGRTVQDNWYNQGYRKTEMFRLIVNTCKHMRELRVRILCVAWWNSLSLVKRQRSYVLISKRERQTVWSIFWRPGQTPSLHAALASSLTWLVGATDARNPRPTTPPNSLQHSRCNRYPSSRFLHPGLPLPACNFLQFHFFLFFFFNNCRVKTEIQN